MNEKYSCTDKRSSIESPGVPAVHRPGKETAGGKRISNNKMMKYFIWVAILFLSCKSRKESNCSVPNWKPYPVYKDVAFIRLPEELLKIKDTAINKFEYDSLLLHVCKLFSYDSLSSVFITARSNELSNKDFLEYAGELQDYYKQLFKYSKNNYSNQQIDTLRNKRAVKFIFLSKRDNYNIAFGGLIFYIDKIRFEILIMINEKDFGDIQNTAECILQSVEVGQ